MNITDVVGEVRKVIQDIGTDSVSGVQIEPRLSNEVLVGFANQALKRIAVLRPDLFIQSGQYPCIAGVEQNLAEHFDRSVRLVDVFRAQVGEFAESSVTEINRETLDQSYPNWPSAVSGRCINFMRYVRDSNRFFIYPPPTSPPESQILHLSYVESPKDYVFDDGEDIALLSDAYFPCVVDATVFVAASMNEESVNNRRAELFYKSFVNVLGISTQSRSITDVEGGGLSEEETV